MNTQPGQTNFTAIGGAASNNATKVLADFDNWARGGNVNVLYKAFALCAILIIFGMIPQTSRFAAWAAWLILVILLVQKKG